MGPRLLALGGRVGKKLTMEKGASLLAMDIHGFEDTKTRQSTSTHIGRSCSIPAPVPVRFAKGSRVSATDLKIN